jgi:hypothetical protein
VDATLPLFLLTLSAVPAVAICDLEKARERLVWADDIKGYVELWHDRGSFGLALEDLELLDPVLVEVVDALADCAFSLTAGQWRLDVRHFRWWADRARLAMAGR